MQVYVYPSTWTGGTEADTLGRLDSLFTVDMDLDGVDDSGYWYKIYKEQAPSFDNPITLNLLDSAVTVPYQILKSFMIIMIRSSMSSII